MQRAKYTPAAPAMVTRLPFTLWAALMWFPADGSPRRWKHGGEGDPANRTLAHLRDLGWIAARVIKARGKQHTERWLTEPGVKARQRLAAQIAARCGTHDIAGMVVDE